MEPVSILFSAISGYGFYYLKSLIDDVAPEKAVVAGIVDPTPEKSAHLSWLKETNIPVFSTMEEFYRSGLQSDLAVISSPPQHHIHQAITALKNGSNVLVDKPPGVGKDEVERLSEAASQSGKWVEVGYQWSFSKAIQDLKRDIQEGLFGDLLKAGSICLWPRDYSYYNRNNWAGRITDPEGRRVYDSPANNACAHFLHNLLFLLGDKWDMQADPVNIEFLKFKVYDIENFDTVCLKSALKCGAEILFYASHAAEYPQDPQFRMEFTGGEVRFEGDKPVIAGRFSDGRIKYYGSPEDDHQFKKLFQCIDAAGKPYQPVCPPEAALPHAKIIDEIQNSDEDIYMFPDNKVVKTSERRWVKGLDQAFKEAYKNYEMLNYEF